MQNPSLLSSMPLAEVVSACQEHTNRYFKKQRFDARYCYELFRRSVVERSQEAWNALYPQYRKLIGSWFKPAQLMGLDEDQESLTNATYAKFWNAVSPEKFAKFQDLSSVLAYLKLCASSVLIDAQRRSKSENDNNDSDPSDSPDDSSGGTDPLPPIIAKELVEQINQRLKDEEEKLVFSAMFTLGMKPLQICEEWPQQVPTVHRVNQIRQNIVDRLRRDESLQRYFWNK